MARPERRDSPLAYLITFRCYGTWLHGDERGSMDRRDHRDPGEPPLPARPDFVGAELRTLKNPANRFSQPRRVVVERAIREVCVHRQWALLAINVRTNHVHVVVATLETAPESALIAFKAYATRALRAEGLAHPAERIWSRHGSTRYLWSDEQIAAAVVYVVDGRSRRRWCMWWTGRARRRPDVRGGGHEWSLPSLTVGLRIRSRAARLSGAR